MITVIRRKEKSDFSLDHCWLFSLKSRAYVTLIDLKPSDINGNQLNDKKSK